MDKFPGREGGTWLGVNSRGKISSLLNVLLSSAGYEQGKSGKGRGFLAVDYLKEDISAIEYLNNIAKSNDNYNKFNLVLLEPHGNKYEAFYYYHGDEPISISDGVHGFGNCPINAPFIKVKKGIKSLEDIIQDQDIDYLNEENIVLLEEKLFSMMRNKEFNHPDPAIMKQGQGISENFLKELSCTWVEERKSNYGSR